jgi:uncharacterized protein (TIGR00369 family)
MMTEPIPGAEELLGVRVTATGHGWAEARMPVPAGVTAADPMPAGLAGMLADVALGRTVLSTLPPDGACRTATLRLDVTGLPLAEGETLAVRGGLLARRDTFALAAGDVLAGGRLVARCSGWFVVLAGAGEPNPYTDVHGMIATRPAGAGLDRLRELTGLIPEDAGAGQFAATIKAGQELANRDQIMHGGMQVVLMEAALSATAGQAAGGARRAGLARIAGLEVTLHRPVPVDGSRLRAAGRIIRAGRRVLAAEAAITGPDGRLLVAATGTFEVTAG